MRRKWVGASIARPQPTETDAARNDTAALPIFDILSKRSASKDLRTDGTAWVKSVRRSLHALRLVGMTHRGCGGFGCGIVVAVRWRTSDARPYERVGRLCDCLSAVGELDSGRRGRRPLRRNPVRLFWGGFCPFLDGKCVILGILMVVISVEV